MTTLDSIKMAIDILQKARREAALDAMALDAANNGLYDQPQSQFMTCPQCHVPSPMPIQPNIKAIVEGIYQTLDELHNTQFDRHPMYSEGYNNALTHVAEYLNGRVNREEK